MVRWNTLRGMRRRKTRFSPSRPSTFLVYNNKRGGVRVLETCDSFASRKSTAALLSPKRDPLLRMQKIYSSFYYFLYFIYIPYTSKKEKKYVSAHTWREKFLKNFFFKYSQDYFGNIFSSHISSKYAYSPNSLRYVNNWSRKYECQI